MRHIPCVWTGQEVLLSALVTEYEKISARIEEILRALFQAGDCDGDENLSMEEFRVVLRIADPTKPAR